MFSECLVGIILLVLLFYYLKKSRKSLKNVPGPAPNIIFGNVLDAIAPRHTQLSILTNYMRRYGNTVKLQIGPFKELVLTSDPKLIEYVLSSTKIIEKSHQYEVAAEWFGNSLFTTTAASWRKQRRLLTPAFHLSVLTRYIDVFERLGSILAKKLGEAVGSDGVNIYPLVNLCTLDIICEAAMGTPVHAQTGKESEFVTSLSSIADIMVYKTLIPLPDWLYPFTPLYFKEKRLLHAYHSYTEGVIDTRIKNMNNVGDDRESFEEKGRPDFLDLLLRLEVDGKPLNRTEIRDQVDTFMFGGQDTTASAITFTLYCLANHPDIQIKVYEEQISLFGNNKDPDIIVTDLQNMKYLETVIKETLRMYSPGSFIARKIEEELEWDGMIFPEDTDITIFIHDLHRNPEIYPDPEIFKPERFENDAGKYQYSFIPFSAGPRNCIGKMFAMLEMKIVISKIVRNFELLPSKPVRELKVTPKLVLTPTNGCYISLKQRM